MSKVEREVVVSAPAEKVYEAWRDFERFPNFMGNIEEVRDDGAGRSHWRAKGPLGTDAEWDAEIVVDEPGRAIAWRSLDTEESSVRTQGAVRFEEDAGATRVFVTMSYDAPAGRLGELAAKIFSNPEKQVEEDLARFKEIIEAGEQPPMPETDRRPVEGRDRPPGQVKGQYPDNEYEGRPPTGPGMPEDLPSRGGPITTSTPGGTLGAPTEGDLKRDQEDLSERTDPRA